MRRNAKSWISRVCAFVSLGCAAALPQSVNAYQDPGHYYTLVALFELAQHEPANFARYRRVIAFCAELPDLSTELDAFTQRTLVLKSPWTWGWGPFGLCTTKHATHMAMTHYYLHGLTGTAAPTGGDQRSVRKAAENLIDTFRDALSRAPNSGEKVNAACAMGFAAHLLADSFAHVQLHRGNIYYPTGIGHGLAVSYPDYVMTRAFSTAAVDSDNDWEHWVHSAASVFQVPDGEQALAKIEATYTRTDAGHDPAADEAKIRKDLISAAGESWERDFESILTSGDPEQNWNAPKSGTFFGRTFSLPAPYRCRDQIERAHLDRDGDPLPNCDQVWKLYYDQAVTEFRNQGVDIITNHSLSNSCYSPSDLLKDGQADE